MCLNILKQNSEYGRTLNASDAVHNVRSLYKLLSSYQGQGRFRGTLALRQILQNHKKKKKRTQGKIWGFFSQILLKVHFEWKIEPKDENN